MIPNPPHVAVGELSIDTQANVEGNFQLEDRILSLKGMLTDCIPPLAVTNAKLMYEPTENLIGDFVISTGSVVGPSSFNFTLNKMDAVVVITGQLGDYFEASFAVEGNASLQFTSSASF